MNNAPKRWMGLLSRRHSHSIRRSFDSSAELRSATSRLHMITAKHWSKPSFALACMMAVSLGCDKQPSESKSWEPVIRREWREWEAAVSITNFWNIKPCRAQLVKNLVHPLSNNVVRLFSNNVVRPLSVTNDLSQTFVYTVVFRRENGEQLVIVDMGTNVDHIATFKSLTVGATYQLPEDVLRILRDVEGK